MTRAQIEKQVRTTSNINTLGMAMLTAALAQKTKR